MSHDQRRFQHERQPLLPWDAVTKEINRQDRLRETQHPQQLPLFPALQQELFPHQTHPMKRPAGRKPKGCQLLIGVEGLP